MAITNPVRVEGYGGAPSDFYTMPWDDFVKDVDEGRIRAPVKDLNIQDR